MTKSKSATAYPEKGTDKEKMIWLRGYVVKSGIIIPRSRHLIIGNIQIYDSSDKNYLFFSVAIGGKTRGDEITVGTRFIQSELRNDRQNFSDFDIDQFIKICVAEIDKGAVKAKKTAKQDHEKRIKETEKILKELKSQKS